MTDFPPLLIEGYERFRKGKLEQKREIYEQLATEGQNPDILLIGCCDSRSSPATIFDTGPGELFVIRNVANLVPPFMPTGEYHGTSAAIEFAVIGLKVKDIVVMGHCQCGGIKAYLDGISDLGEGTNFIGKWVSMIAPAAKGIKDLPSEKQAEALERLTIINSLKNLRTFPMIQEREKAGELRIHGVYFDVGSGSLEIYDEAQECFVLSQKLAAE